MTTPKNQRVLRTIPLLTIAVTLCFILVGKAAPAAEQIDQSNLPEWAGGWTHVNPAGKGHAVMWQTFTPACPNTIAVEIDILTLSPGQGDDVLTVEIAKEGDILASADCSVADGFNGLLRFEFPDAVPLVPEQIYQLAVRDTGKTRFGWKYGSNTYERGSRYVFAQELPYTDWFFRTYSKVEPAQVQYNGGTGEPNDPYRIATASQMNAIGANPGDWSMHFKLMADIDMSGFDGRDGRPAYNIIGPDTLPETWEYDGTPFTGVFDGNGHVISHLTITGERYLGLFGLVGSGAVVKNLGVADANITGSNDIGAIVGGNGDLQIRYIQAGVVSGCYSTGAVSGDDCVGGLVGRNYGTVTNCYSTVTVSADAWVGGLVGSNDDGIVTEFYSTGVVTGADASTIGGLVGLSPGIVLRCV